MLCKAEMDSFYLSQLAGLTTGNITADLRLKSLGLLLKCKYFTSVGAALSSTLGLEGAVSLSKEVETTKKTEFVFFFLPSSTSLYQTWSAQNCT